MVAIAELCQPSLTKRGRESCVSVPILTILNSRNSEVDFYVPDEKYAVQACVTLSDADTKDREVSALMKLDRLENLERMVIVTRDEKESIPIPGGRAIEVLPAAEWLLE